MKFSLGFDERHQEIQLLTDADKEIEYINIYPLLDVEETQAVNLLQQHLEFLKNKLTSEDEIITSNQVINYHIQG
jgi:hypothetical protein